MKNFFFSFLDQWHWCLQWHQNYFKDFFGSSDIKCWYVGWNLNLAFLLNYYVFFCSDLGDEEDSNGVNRSSDDITQTHGYYYHWRWYLRGRAFNLWFACDLCESLCCTCHWDFTMLAVYIWALANIEVVMNNSKKLNTNLIRLLEKHFAYIAALSNVAAHCF